MLLCFLLKLEVLLLHRDLDHGEDHGEDRGVWGTALCSIATWIMARPWLRVRVRVRVRARAMARARVRRKHGDT